MNYGLLNMTEGTTLSTENISVQKNDPVVKFLNDRFGVVRDAIKDNKLARGVTFKSREVRIAFAEIDKMNYERFGIYTKTIESRSHVMAVQTTAPKASNVLAGNITKNYADIKKALVMNGADESEVSRAKLSTSNPNWVDVCKTYLQSIRAVDKQLETDGMAVDLKKAKIYGYPKDATVVIMVNPHKLIARYDLTPDEVTAAYLHEIGHAFTHIEYSYRTIRQTSDMIESIISEVDKNKPPLAAIKLSYAKVFKNDKLDDSTNAVSAAVGVTNAYIEDLHMLGDNTNTLKDSERLADQFAVRFGMGPQLSTALDKMGEGALRAIGMAVGSFLQIMIAIFIISCLIGIFVPIIMALGTFTVAIASIYLLSTVAGSFAVYSLGSMFMALFNRGIDTAVAHDVPLRRIYKMKNELVRQLRTSHLDKSETSAILSAVDVLLMTAKNASGEDDDFFHRVAGVFFSYSDQQKEMRYLDYAIEDLMNNNIHLMANKLKTV